MNASHVDYNTERYQIRSDQISFLHFHFNVFWIFFFVDWCWCLSKLLESRESFVVEIIIIITIIDVTAGERRQVFTFCCNDLTAIYIHLKCEHRLNFMHVLVTHLSFTIASHACVSVYVEIHTILHIDQVKWCAILPSFGDKSHTANTNTAPNTAFHAPHSPCTRSFYFFGPFFSENCIRLSPHL